jgi:hypothetical protein
MIGLTYKPESSHAVAPTATATLLGEAMPPPHPASSAEAASTTPKSPILSISSGLRSRSRMSPKR